MKALRGHPLDAAFGADTLRGADPRIVVTNISQEIAVKASYGENSGRDGRRKHRVRREVIRVTVAFKIWEFESVPDREAAVEAANAWARDGWLTITSKPGRRLMVQCAGRAATRNPRDYKEEYQLIFETAQSPFWEDEAPAVFTLSGTADTAEIRVPGTYESVFDVSVAHASGTLNALTLAVGDTTMSFSGLAVAAGVPLTLCHDDAGRLMILAGSASKYACRSAASDDELLAGPGVVTAAVTAGVSCTVTLSVRGRYR